jgi:hypothetical protein
MLGIAPGAVKIFHALGDPQHGPPHDGGAPASLLPGGQWHELHLPRQLRQILSPGTRQPIGHQAKEDGAVEPHLIARCIELRCVDGNPVGPRGPRHHGGQHPGIALGVHHQPFLRVKERSASL